MPEAEAEAAAKLQAIKRGNQARTFLREKEEEEAAALKVQAISRGATVRKELAEERAQESAAAAKLQAIQRGNLSRKALAASADDSAPAEVAKLSEVRLTVDGPKRRGWGAVKEVVIQDGEASEERQAQRKKWRIYQVAFGGKAFARRGDAGDPAAEAVRAWIRAVLTLGQDSKALHSKKANLSAPFRECLKSGWMLCRLLNCLEKDAVSMGTIGKGRNKMAYMENLNRYNRACVEKLSLPEAETLKIDWAAATTPEGLAPLYRHLSALVRVVKAKGVPKLVLPPGTPGAPPERAKSAGVRPGVGVGSATRPPH